MKCKKDAKIVEKITDMEEGLEEQNKAAAKRGLCVKKSNKYVLAQFASSFKT